MMSVASRIKPLLPALIALCMVLGARADGLIDRLGGYLGLQPKAAAAQSYPDDRRANTRLSFEAKLLYTTLLGRPYGLAAGDLQFERLPKQLSPLGFSLAAAAQQALRLPAGQGGSSRDKLIYFLSSATEPYALADLPADLPAGMRSDDLAMLHVYALVMSGQADATVELLGKTLNSPTQFSRHFAIMALRSIGTARAHELIKSRSDNPDDQMIAKDALRLELPNLIEPYRYAGEVPVDQRYRSNLLAQARRNDTQAILPTMLLGFVGEDAPPAQLAAEREFLGQLYRTADSALWRRYMYGYASLAFRFQLPFEQWLAMYQSDKDLWRRAFILRMLARQHPDRFVRDTLPLLARETNSSIQWEYLSLYRGLSQGEILSGPFDAIWVPPLLYRVYYPAHKAADQARDPAPLFRAWAKGDIAEDALWSEIVVQMLRPQYEADYLRGYLKMKKRDDYAAATLSSITDRKLLPLLDYLASREPSPAAGESIRKWTASLRSAAQAQCCAATETCLRSQLEAEAPAKISSDAEALRFLDSGGQTVAGPRITFLDELKRHARISRSGRKDQEWEHLLGCWRVAQ